jgi:hypothetical protein
VSLKPQYGIYLGIKEAGKEIILNAAGNDALALLKKQYIGFRNLTVLSMINHLRLKTAIKIMTVQKHKYMLCLKKILKSIRFYFLWYYK